VCTAGKLIEGLNLGGSGTAEALRKAGAWCEREGVDSADELKEAAMEGEFVAALGLKNAKTKILTKRLAELPPQASASHKTVSGKI
jgi:hypothetical protein